MRKFTNVLIFTLGLFMVLNLKLFAAGEKGKSVKKFGKIMGHEDRRRGIHDGNNILTVFFNYGDIGNWFEDSNRLVSGIWPKGSGHSYFAEFCPFVGAEVFDAYGQRRHIFSDGEGYTGRADMAPGGEYQYGFEPIPGYFDPNQDYIAMYNAQGAEDNDGPDGIPAHMGSEDDDGKPDSWPWIWPDKPDWVDPRSGIPFWDGQYGAYARATQESYYRMNDDANDEFQFYPDPNDSSKRGLGLEVEVRGYQWADPQAEDIIIFTFWITNTGKYLYEKTIFGMYGDADIGEQEDNSDDLSEFNKDEDIVYQWDNDLWTPADGGFSPGFFGWKFLESPGDPRNGVDDDGDGLIGADGNPWDESQDDGIDNDHDWDPKIDDIGSDGIGPEHPDYPGPDRDGTEGNGVPDRGEPNFEYTDNDESDQIGLTSFLSADWKASLIELGEDEKLWSQTIPGSFSRAMNQVDIVMHYGSGYFSLPPAPEPDSRRKFAISMVMGADRDDLVRNAMTMQQIYDADYNFAAVPLKPNVTAVPGDRKVTLYWDKRAEGSRDPIYGYDFEGYVIYRATDPGFLESYIGTDTYGNKSFNKPIAQFDLIDGLKGPHPVSRDGIQFNMGKDTGLQYTFVDSGQTWAGPVENGQTYFYAVCSFDKGYYDDFYSRGLSEFDSLQAKAPAVCGKRIQFDASGEVTFVDVNCVQIVPNAPAAGYVAPPRLDRDNGAVKQASGSGTGSIVVDPIDPTKIDDGAEYEILFDDSSHFEMENNKKVITDTTFYVKDTRQYTETVKLDTNFVLLKKSHLVPSSLTVKIPGDEREFQIDVDYEVGFTVGNFRVLPGGALPVSSNGDVYYGEVNYQYYPIFDSPFLNGEDRNDYFDGLRVLVQNHKLEASQERSGWLTGDDHQRFLAEYGFIGENDKIPENYQTKTNYDYQVGLYSNQGVAVPYDFLIVIYDSIVVKSANNKWANFRVFNVTTGDTAEFVFFDTDKDSALSDQDYLTPITYVNHRKRGTWEARFRAPKNIIVSRDSLNEYGYAVKDKEGEIIKIPVDTIVVEKFKPKAGDMFYLAVNKPFTSQDKFTFAAKGAYVDYKVAHAKETLRDIAVVPNPYVVTASWEPQHFYSSGRGKHKIDFIHLPPKCTIKIFTMRGYLVDTVEHDSPIDDGAQSWDMLTKDGMEIAYGVYVFHVSTPSGENYIGKFAVIK
ncbi:MAG: hypothetical protein GXO74_14640 [Calditrichaeota bacterium]|nr:hypothetical protein [Calditrichota bacterium]